MTTSTPVLSEFVIKECIAGFHLPAAAVVEATSSPDQTDTLDQGKIHMFIHSKKITAAKPEYHVVTVESRENGQRKVDIALKIYSDLQPGLDALSPTHMLEALLKQYGVEIEIGTQRSHFIWAARIPIAHMKDFRVLGGAASRQGQAMMQQMYILFESGPPLVANCALCFCLNTTRYVSWLQTHKR